MYTIGIYEGRDNIMAEKQYIQRIRTENGDLEIDYTALANKPNAADIGAVAKAGDTMTGPLKTTSMRIGDPNSEYPALNFYSPAGNNTGSISQNTKDGKRQITLKQIHNDQDGSTYYADAYSLPVATAGLTEHKYYSILTTKEPVKVTQGGTGATTAEQARKNLGINTSDFAAVSHNHDRLIYGNAQVRPYEHDSRVGLRGYNSAREEQLYLYSDDTTNGALKYITTVNSANKYGTVYTDLNPPPYPVTSVNGKTGAVTISSATKVNYTGTLAAGSWSGSWPYTQSLTISGILATDTPVVDLDMSKVTSGTETDTQAAWACVGRIVTAANKITAYCYDSPPEVALPITLMVVR